jgi:hypothetical protein
MLESLGHDAGGHAAGIPRDELLLAARERMHRIRSHGKEKDEMRNKHVASVAVPWGYVSERNQRHCLRKHWVAIC